MAETSEETWRLFVALEAPEPIKDALAKAQARLRRAVLDASIRWLTREQFHLTLRFLGAVPAGHVDDLTAALETACKNCPTFPLRARHIGFFPNDSFPRVIWSGVSDETGALAQLHGTVRHATNDFTHEKPEAHFSGHITLGRVKEIRARDSQALCAAAADFRGVPFGAWAPSTVDLIRSRLSGSGATYERVSRFALVTADAR